MCISFVFVYVFTYDVYLPRVAFGGTFGIHPTCSCTRDFYMNTLGGYNKLVLPTIKTSSKMSAICHFIKIPVDERKSR